MMTMCLVNDHALSSTSIFPFRSPIRLLLGFSLNKKGLATVAGCAPERCAWVLSSSCRAGQPCVLLLSYWRLQLS